VKFEPSERNKGIEFVDDVFGGAIPKNWIPSVERGIREAAARGFLAFKEAMKTSRPSLLEPVMHVEVYAPDQYSGDLMGDLSSRRGRIAGSESRGHNVIVRAQVPFSEMLSYATDLTSMTQGRATYSMEFSHYDYVPGDQADKVIAAHKALHGEALVEEEA